MRRVWRFIYVLLIAVVVALLWAFTIPGFLAEEWRQTYMVYFNIVRAITAIMLGILVIELTASLITVRLKHLGRGVYLVRNVIVVMGYVIVGLLVLAISEVTGVSAVAAPQSPGLLWFRFATHSSQSFYRSNHSWNRFPQARNKR